MGRPRDENPSPDALRKRFKRELRRWGYDEYPVFVHSHVVTKLIERGEMNEEDARDQRKVGALLGRYLEDYLEFLSTSAW